VPSSIAFRNSSPLASAALMALGGEDGEVFLAHVHHERGGQVVRLGQQAAGFGVSELGREPASPMRAGSIAAKHLQ
jgi:hypothetical protein